MPVIGGADDPTSTFLVGKIGSISIVTFRGDGLLAVGDEELIKIHFHMNESCKVLEYCVTIGEIYDIIVEDLDRQARGWDKYHFCGCGEACNEN